MLNVVYVLNSTYAWGGASKSFISMLEGLRRRGIYPIVVMPDREGLYHILRQMGIECVVSCFRPNTYPHNRSSLIFDERSADRFGAYECERDRCRFSPFSEIRSPSYFPCARIRGFGFPRSLLSL